MSATLSGWAGPLAVEDPEPIAQLREVLVAAGFDGDAVRSALGMNGVEVVRPGDAPLLRRRLAGLGKLGTITSLFVLDTELPVGEVEAAFAPVTTEQLESMGLVEMLGESVRARVQLVPHDDVLIASDLSSNNLPDHVAGALNSSVTLANLTVRLPAEAALDVGTGCGIQAILAARHCERVIGTDVNGRALNFAAFNALLNGTANIELRAGSYLEPAAGERFDLVVTNPPFVVSPDTGYLFRDSGLAGDAVSLELVRGAPALLDEGAFATVLVSWAAPPGGDWFEPLRETLAQTGCDAVLLYYGTQDPLTHAASWTQDAYGGDPAAFDATLERWLAYLAELGIEGIAYGAVVLRRRTAADNWTVARNVPGTAGTRPAGAHLQRIFETADYLAATGDVELCNERFTLVAGARVEQRVVLRAGEWAIDEISLELDEGLGFGANIDPLIAHLLAGFDGTRTFAEAATDVAERSGSEHAAFTAKALPVVREMLALGFLEHASR